MRLWYNVGSNQVDVRLSRKVLRKSLQLAGLWAALAQPAAASEPASFPASTQLSQTRLLPPLTNVPTLAAVQSAFDTPPEPLLRRPFDLEAAIHASDDAEAVALASHRLAAQDWMAAQNALDTVQNQRSPAAALVQARVDLAVGNEQAAVAALGRAAADGNLLPWVMLERGRVALALGQAEEAAAELEPLSRSSQPLAAQTAVLLAQALAQSDPAGLLEEFPRLERLRDGHDGEARSLLLAALGQALAQLGDPREANNVALRRYLEEPLAKATPALPPAGVQPSAEQLLGRAERLVEAHRNEASWQALEALQPQLSALLQDPNLACRYNAARGIVARKRHRYAEAEAQLGWVMANCPDPDQRRKAAFVQAKVISIQDGLRALPVIEAFAKAYPEHTMTDDVLFWAGDSLQRRGRDAEAAAYFRRIINLPRPDDQCGEASWRLGWMALRAGDKKGAERALQQSLGGRCGQDGAARARAHYWLGRLSEQSRKVAAATGHYQEVLRLQPLSFYAQQALPRLLAQQRPQQRAATLRGLKRPQAPLTTELCPAGLPRQPAFGRALYLVGLGLHTDALVELRRLRQAGPAASDTAPLARCGNGQASLLLSQLLDRVGGHKEAHSRLLRDFASTLQRLPTTASLPIWQAAYPLAYRAPLAAAEAESGLPAFLLQALSREESRFDAEVVSWAEAIGLTQLLLPSAQLAGRTLKPRIFVTDPLALHDPALNARLGGALLAHYGARLGGSWPLALAAYNGGQETALAWWRRFAGQEMAVFSEEMTIFETRTYVQRVMQTFGIYRWLYGETPPKLACPDFLPRR